MRLHRGIRYLLTSLGMVLAVGAVAFTGAALQEEPFSHEEHAGLFPVCTGCHTGVEQGDRAAFYPPPELCARCHDGADQERVSWTPPGQEPGNLRYEHQEHARELAAEGEPRQSCEACHTSPGADRMAVRERVELESCFSCHAHEAEDHYADADCATCHAPLAESDLPTGRIAALPVPADHEGSAFLLASHGLGAAASTERCVVCHTQDRCVSCHVATDRPAIQALPAAPASMELPPAAAHYPVPASHTDEGWLAAHGRQAGVGECSTCHATEDCTVCHQAPVPDLVAGLPSRADAVAPGVRVARRAPETHASFFFQEAHGTLAAADEGSCATCHTEDSCVACHDGPSNGGYHPSDFVSRHTAVAYGQDAECSTCHNTAVFCRSCHQRSGFESQGRLGSGYHDAEPIWLLRHGQAARQNLEGCVSCHEQRDCMQCHSTLGSFQISPHPRDFNAEAAWARNPRTCLACHVRNPLDGSAP